MEEAANTTGDVSADESMSKANLHRVRSDLQAAIQMQSLGMLQQAVSDAEALQSSEVEDELKNARLMIKTLSFSHHENRRKSQVCAINQYN